MGRKTKIMSSFFFGPCLVATTKKTNGKTISRVSFSYARSLSSVCPSQNRIYNVINGISKIKKDRKELLRCASSSSFFFFHFNPGEKTSWFCCVVYLEPFSLIVNLMPFDRDWFFFFFSIIKKSYKFTGNSRLTATDTFSSWLRPVFWDCDGEGHFPI